MWPRGRVLAMQTLSTSPRRPRYFNARDSVDLMRPVTTFPLTLHLLPPAIHFILSNTSTLPSYLPSSLPLTLSDHITLPPPLHLTLSHPNAFPPFLPPLHFTLSDHITFLPPFPLPLFISKYPPSLPCTSLFHIPIPSLLDS